MFIFDFLCCHLTKILFCALRSWNHFWHWFKSLVGWSWIMHHIQSGPRWFKSLTSYHCTTDSWLLNGISWLITFGWCVFHTLEPILMYITPRWDIQSIPSSCVKLTRVWYTQVPCPLCIAHPGVKHTVPWRILLVSSMSHLYLWSRVFCATCSSI